MFSRLSEAERQFLEKYLDLVESNLKAGYLAHIPQRFAKLDGAEMVIAPRSDSYAFMRVTRDVGAFELPDESLNIELKRGELIAAPYDAFSSQRHFPSHFPSSCSLLLSLSLLCFVLCRSTAASHRSHITRTQNLALSYA